MHQPRKKMMKVRRPSVRNLIRSIIEHQPIIHAKIIIGDLSANIGQEEIFRPTIGKWSLHDISNDNGLRAIDFATSNNMIIRSTYFPRKNKHRGTWRSPDGVTKNQIDHVMIDGRHASSIIDVRSCRGADCDTDHFLVRIKYRQRISNYRRISGERKEKYDVEQLKDERTLKKYYEEIGKIMETD
jgi:hypothetical protein